METTTTITILGSTGSIGVSTLAVIDKNPAYRLHALTAYSNSNLLFEQCQKYQPTYAVLVNDGDAAVLADRLAASTCRTQLLVGKEALEQVASASDVDTVMAAIVGTAGLQGTLAAVNSGKKVLLANKESLVMCGELFMAAAADSGARIIPIDSEHNAIFQCLPLAASGLDKAQTKFVDKIVLTASGGPFLHTELDSFDKITPEMAVRHPKWEMGKKISVDSATMMNKGLEFIEASYLFGLDHSQIEVLIHPQSVVHSMVHYLDGSVLAQMGTPDMRIPIAYGLAWPERIASGAKSLDLAAGGTLEFQKPDLQRFPCLRLGMEAVKLGGTAPAILNAANEIAVAAFLAGTVSFLQIARINEAVMKKIPCEAAASLAIIQDIDDSARKLAKELILKGFC